MSGGSGGSGRSGRRQASEGEASSGLASASKCPWALARGLYPFFGPGHLLTVRALLLELLTLTLILTRWPAVGRGRLDTSLTVRALLLELRVLADLLDVLLHGLLELGVLHHRPHARLRRRVLQLLERLPEHEVWWVWCAG